MKHLAFLSTVIFLFTNNVFAKGGWEKYSSDEAKMEISFPFKYEEEREEKGNATTIKASAEQDENTYMLSATIHETPLEEHYQLASMSLEAFTEAVQGTIKEQSDFTYSKDQVGKEALIELPRQDVLVHYKVLIIGQIQYQVLVVDQTHDIDKEIEKFFKSFKVKG